MKRAAPAITMEPLCPAAFAGNFDAMNSMAGNILQPEHI